MRRQSLWATTHVQISQEERMTKMKTPVIPPVPEVDRFQPLLGDEERVALKMVAKRLMEPGKGVLMVDESVEQLGAKLEKHKMYNNQQNRVGYVVSMLSDVEMWRPYVSGVVFRESVYRWLRHRSVRKIALSQLENKNVQIGIRVDKDLVQQLSGTHGEVTSSGQDALHNNCRRWKDLGVSFVTMNCVFYTSEYTPSLLAYTANTSSLARCASICQEAGLVPMLSLQVLSPGQGSTETQQQQQQQQQRPLNATELRIVTEDILAFFIKALSDHHVYLEGALLRLSPVSPPTMDIKTAAIATLKAIINRIPPAFGGVLLSDQDTLFDSSEILNEMALILRPKPCLMTFAWGQVIRHGLLDVWRGKDKNVPEVINWISKRLKTCSEASMGQLSKNQPSLFIAKIPSSEVLSMPEEIKWQDI